MKCYQGNMWLVIDSASQFILNMCNMIKFVKVNEARAQQWR